MVVRLGSGEVIIWWMEVASVPAETMVRWRAMLSPAELARADRFRLPADRTMYVAAHASTRRLLSEMGGVTAGQIRFVTGRHGKPAVSPVQCSGLEFNLSHSGGVVTVAATMGNAVGVDVESCDRDIGLGIAERFFAPTEVDALARLPPSVRSDAFLRLWTLKEAYAKATGEGLQRLDRVAFSLDPVRVHFGPEIHDDPAAWQFFERRVTPRHLLALALHRPCAEPASVLLRAVEQPEV